MEETVDHRLAQECAHERRRKRRAVLAGLDQRVAVVELDSVDPFERQHPPGGAPPVDLGNIIAGLGDHVLAELGRGRGLALKVEFARGPLLEMGDDEARPQPLELAAHALDLRSRPFVSLDRPLRIPPRCAGGAP